MGCLSGAFGIILPRFILLVGWYNNPDSWTSLFSSGLMFFAGWFFLPWTTLIYGFVAPNGLSLINWIFLAFAFLADIGTYGFGALAARRQAPSNFRQT